MDEMTQPHTPLALQLLALYWSGRTVSSISAITGLPEPAIITRLCAASRSLKDHDWTALDNEGGLGVQWEFVFLRG
jgi:hypothetical protein